MKRKWGVYSVVIFALCILGIMEGLCFGWLYFSTGTQEFETESQILSVKKEERETESQTLPDKKELESEEAETTTTNISELSVEDILAYYKPYEQRADEEVMPYGQSKTLTGYDPAHAEPTIITVGVTDIKKGQDAYDCLLEYNVELPAPPENMEYIVVTVNYSYHDGPVEEIYLYESHGTHPEGKHFFFLAHTINMTGIIQDNIYKKSVKKGESVEGQVAFLSPIGNDWPFAFFGWGKKVGFSI